MASGMEGLGSNSLINALDLARTAPTSLGQIGSFKGTSVAPFDSPSTPGLKKNSDVNQKDLSEPPKIKLPMRDIKKPKESHVMASIKGAGTKIRSLGRSALKEVKHKFGELKRLLFNENFKKISSDSFEKVSSDTKIKLEDNMNEFNNKLSELNSLKDELGGIINEMQGFEDTYGRSLEVVDNPSALLKNKGAIKLSLPGKSGEPIYKEISPSRSGEGNIRGQAIDKFVEEMQSSAEYIQHTCNVVRLEEIKDERNKLKEEIKDIRESMLTDFSSDLNKRMESELTLRTGKLNDQSSSELQTKINQKREIISGAEEKIKNLDNKKIELRSSISALNKRISDVSLNISRNTKAVSYIRDELKYSVEEGIKKDREMLENLKESLNNDKQSLADIPSHKTEENKKLHDAKKEYEKLKSSSSAQKQLTELKESIEKDKQKQLTTFRNGISANRF